MGLARHAPMDHYRRKRKIPQHAVDRLRERASRDLTCRDDRDLGNLIDSAVAESIDQGHFESFSDRGEPTKLVDVSHLIDVQLHALVRADRDGDGECVVTLLTPEQVDANRASGRWTKDDRGGGGAPVAFAKLGERITLPALALPERPSLAAAPVIAPLAQPSAPAPIAPDDDWLLRYPSSNGALELTSASSREGVEEQVRSLVIEGKTSPELVRVYKRVQVHAELLIKLGD